MNQALADAPFGTTISKDGRITFRFFAPGKDAVHLIGSFNDFDHEADPLESDGDGVWSISKSLDSGEHEYRFVVDGQTVVGDPYATEVRFPTDDKQGLAILRVGGDGYAWRHDDWQAPAYRDLIIYEINLTDFVPEAEPGEAFAAATDRLDYLVDLGMNAVELMPVFARPGPGWGYDPTHLFAVHPRFGALDDLRRFVDTCHAKGIAVILDIVLSHTGPDHAFAQLWSLEDSPFYSEPLTEDEQEFGLPSFDYRSDHTWRFVRDVLRYWIDAAHIDGYRLDYLKLPGIENGDATSGLADLIRDVRENRHVIGEHIPEDPGEVNASGLSGAWHKRFTHAIRSLLLHADLHGFSYDDLPAAAGVLDHADQGYDGPTQMVNYLETHDENRLLEHLQNEGVEPELAAHLSALSASILFTAPGIPLIYHGQEWGEDTQRDEQSNPIHWDRLEQDPGRGLHEHYRKLIRLRRDHPALRANGFTIDLADNDAKTLVYHRWNGEGDVVLVAANFSDERRTVDVAPPSEHGAYHDVIADRSIQSGDRLTIELDARQAAVLIPG